MGDLPRKIYDSFVHKWLKDQRSLNAEKQVINMFMGEYNHTIDTKGRLIIPAKFRESLGEHFVVTQGLDGCLFAYDNSEWEIFEKQLQSMLIGKKDTRNFARFFLARAAEVEVDKQGRILVPSKLREFAGLEKDVVMVGVGNRVEIWNKDTWEDTVSFDDMEEIAEKMADLGIGI